MNWYPTEDELQTIREWQPEKGYHALMEYIGDIWNYKSDGEWPGEDNIYRLSTGGWSGNEDIIGAMMGNHLFWMRCWLSSKRGGHYTFEKREWKADDKKEDDTRKG